MDVSNRRILILGQTGTGKSSVANTIFGEKLFEIGDTVNSEPSECRAETKSINGRNITLIDTPGLFDTYRSEEELKPEIVKCITECAPGLHAFLIVFSVGRFTERNQDVITEINQCFSEEVFKYATVLFTHGEQLKEGQTIEDFVRDNKLVSELVKKCGGRCHVIDNKYWKNNQQDEYRSNQFQVKELLKTIEERIEANKGSCYTNEMLQAVEEEIKQEEEHIRQSSGDMPEEEIREKAKDRVFKSVLMPLAGITTSALLGAIFVRAMVIKKVLSVVKARFAVAKTVAPAAAGPALIAIIATGVVLVAGVAGYYAIKETDTPLEAAKTAAEVNKNGSKAIVD